MRLKCILFGLLISNQVFSAFIPLRCKTWGDSLNAEQAIARRDWAWKCFPSFRGMIKFHEQLFDETTKLLTEGYPTFGVSDKDGNILNPQNWFAPADANAECTAPADYMIVSYCGAGCYTPEQKVWFRDGEEAIGDAHAKNLLEIVTLSSTSESRNLHFISSLIDYYVTDLVPGMQDILRIYMLSGGSLRVTTNHPLVDSEGRMRSADSLKIGESLVMASGEFDPIIAIESEQYFGNVYNVEVKNGTLAEKIIVAQGYLNGTAHYQNDGVREINRIILRTNLISDSLVQ